MLNFTKKHFPALIYFFVSLFLLVIKFWSFYLTSSKGIFSDALESIVNVLAATFIIFIFYQKQNAKDKFPYGTGKLEYVATIFEGGLISFASIMIIIESISAFVNKTPLQKLDEGIFLILFTAIVNLILGLFLRSQSKRLQSDALKASSEHVLSDTITTGGVILSLVIVQKSGLFFIDHLVAFVLGLVFLRVGFRCFYRGIINMIDKEDLQLLEKLRDTLNKIKPYGIIQVHQVKIIRSGDFHHIDSHFVIPEFWNISETHDVLNELEKNIQTEYGNKVELGVHLDPCRQKYCKSCNLKDCSIRKEDFVEREPFSVSQMRDKYEPF